MPINIYKLDAKHTRVAWLCDDEWQLPKQITELRKWINRKKKKEDYECIADVGFQCRKDAGGGGSALDSKVLKKLGDFGITLYLSEYPGFAKKTK